MTCRLLVRKSSKFAIIKSPVVNFLSSETAKWQSHAVSSATFSAATTNRNRPTCYAGRKQTHHLNNERVRGTTPSAGFTEDISSRIAGYIKYTTCQDSCVHLLRVRQHPQARHCYSTQPNGDISSSKANTQVEDSNAQLTQREKLKRAVKEYGSTVIVFHISHIIGISWRVLPGCFKWHRHGGNLEEHGCRGGHSAVQTGDWHGTFVVAYAVHKVFAPVRIGITLTSTPFIVRYLRSKGILKPPKP